MVKEEDINKEITFEAPEVGIDYYTYLCNIWYWNEYNHVYSMINMYEESNQVIPELPFILRESIINHKNYIQSVIKYNSKK